MSVPWDQTDLYRTTGNRQILPGGPTTYNPPRPIGKDENAEDVTSFHPGQADWSPENMPDILYMYKSPQEREHFWKSASKPAPKYNGNDIVYEKWPVPGEKPRKLLDYPHLPDQIGTNEYWWVFEAWRRLDPRITWDDIFMRQYKPNRTSCSNTVQRLGSRNRTNAMMVSWTLQREGLRKSNERKRVHEYASLNAGDKPSGKSGGVLAKDGPATKTKAKKKTIKPSDMVTPLMTDAQKAANTTRGLTPGLINKDLGEVPGNRVPWPDKSKLAGHHHAKKSQRAPRKKGIGSRRIDREARQSQGPSTQQPLDVGDSAILEGDQDTVSDDGTELASEQFSESTGLEEASGEESLEHGDAPSGDQTDEDSQSEAEMPHKNLRLWVQPAPPHAPRGITASHRTVASRGEPSWSYSIPPRAEMEPDNDNDWHMPGNFLSNAPARDLATQPHFPPPSQASHASSSTHHQTSSHQKRLAFPGTINDPAHPLYIPPFPVQAAAKEQTVIPTAVAAHQQAPMNNNLGNGNGNQQASATAGPPTASSAQIPPRITDHVRLTCPDNLTPSRWAEFLEFCVIHGIGRRDQSPDQLAPSEANTNRTSDQTLSRGLENQDGQAEWTVQDEQDEEWERSLRQ